MAEYTGRSTVGSLQTSVPAMAGHQYEINTDPFTVMPEIMYRAYHQQQQLQPKKPFVPQVAPGGMKAANMGGAAQQLNALTNREAAPTAKRPGRQPYFLKMLNIGGQSGGYVPAQAWEPGAIAAGFMPEGMEAPAPKQASFGGGPAVSGASLGMSSLPAFGAGETASRPPAPGPGEALGFNPYATGVGVQGGRYVFPPGMVPQQKQLGQQ